MVFGFMLFAILVVNGIAKQPMGVWTGYDYNPIGDMSKLTTTDTRYYLLGIFVVFTLGFIIEGAYDLMKTIRNRNIKRDESTDSKESLYPSKKENVLVVLLKWIIKN
jgi:hypothetical protein